VLSRLAESLYWVGRYVERAEDGARILDVHVHHMLEDPAVNEEAACRVLLEAMCVDEPDHVDSAAVARALAFDRSNPCSVVGSLVAARDHAGSSREVLSSEMWECLNSTYHALDRLVPQGADERLHGFFSWVKERAAIVAGLTEATMTRDDAWRFLVLGRSLERVDMTSRLLWAGFNHPAGGPDWAATLRSCSAQEAFLRSYRRPSDAGRVVEFLLLDRLFPRSVLFSLRLAEQCLGEIDPTSERAGVEDEARRVLGRARNDLEFARIGELLDDLPAYLRSLQTACAEAGNAVGKRFFHHTSTEGTLEAVARP
jgi:uncharacterized alpha-E superfamily protein